MQVLLGLMVLPTRAHSRFLAELRCRGLRGGDEAIAAVKGD